MEEFKNTEIQEKVENSTEKQVNELDATNMQKTLHDVTRAEDADKLMENNDEWLENQLKELDAFVDEYHS